MRAILECLPTTNYGLASPSERSDAMASLARVFMGLSHPVQIVGQAREVAGYADWPHPPRLARRWLAVITAEDDTTLRWRLRTLRMALEGAGLRCEEGSDLYKPRLIAEPWRMIGRDWIRQGSEFCSTLVLRRWPREVAPGWLGQALASDLPVDVALHVEPQDAQQVARFLRGQIGWQSQGQPDAANELGRSDAERMRLELVARTDRPSRVAIALTVRANSREQLRTRVETLRHEIGLTLGDARVAAFEQDRGLEATAPSGTCRLLGAWRLLDCHSVASTWPFQPATIQHENGAPIGTTHDGAMLVKLDPFDWSLESFGGLVVGKVGSGKSFFLKLLARRLLERGVEVLIVEQRTPAEYGAVPGRHVNLADVPYSERADRLRAFVSDLWETAKRDPRPRLLVLDELWSLLRDPALASLIEEIARIGRHHYLSLWIATQQVRELLASGQAVLDNAAVRVYLKQHDRDLEDLCDAVGMSAIARRFLRGALRGQCLLDCNGLLVAVDIQASLEEHSLITTDPREKRNGTLDVARDRNRPTGDADWAAPRLGNGWACDASSWAAPAE